MDFESAIQSNPNWAPDRQASHRESLGLNTPEICDLLARSDFISLGGFCGTSSALELLGLRKAAGPFDWVRCSASGVLRCFETDFADFLSYAATREECGHKVFEQAKWGGSFWHHNPTEQETKDQFARRIERLIGVKSQQSAVPRFFIRVANSTDELELMPVLLAKLQQTFSRSPVYLLVILDMQMSDALVHISDTSSHLLFHKVHKDLWLNSSVDVATNMEVFSRAYAGCIASAIRHWAAELIVPVQDACAAAWPVSFVETWTDHYDGGDPTRNGYAPSGEPPGYMRVREGLRPGMMVQAGAFGRQLSVRIPEGATVGSVLELRLKGDVLRIRLILDTPTIAAALALLGVTTTATATSAVVAATSAADDLIPSPPDQAASPAIVA